MTFSYIFLPGDVFFSSKAPNAFGKNLSSLKSQAGLEKSHFWVGESQVSHKHWGMQSKGQLAALPAQGIVSCQQQQYIFFASTDGCCFP